MDTIITGIPLLAAGTGAATGAGEWSNLIFYVVLALGVSFLCSIWEAAMLSTPVSHIELLVQEGSQAGVIMQGLRQNVEHPISAILTLNTIAHTVGATRRRGLKPRLFLAASSLALLRRRSLC